ncbi:hypothetical protein ES319_D09G069600v1 [Gossypium barbadense]|uniref:TLDc domain-containing protein n=1 Tax=Gossypium barbadense TaxID=3634 RepID=A0A5J5Q516_GOSBA|nr:hypothetical protein ES319_D09G069600v1 [Gossypium barbadense]
MNKFKDKTAGSLSHLFSDSPSPSSPPQLQLYQGRWYSKGLNSLSSLFSYIIPSASIDDDDKPKSNDHGNVDIKPIGSLPDRWRNQKLQLEDESLDSCKEYTITYVSEDLKKVCEDKKSIWTEFENKQQMISPRGGGGSSSDSDEFHEAGEQLSPVKGSLNLSDESVFINRELFEFLGSSLPNIVKGCQWVLLYRLNGTSGPCETFGNKCLAHNEEFELKNVELWGFKHAYRNTLN